jgi:hypothetical protein
LAGVEGIATAAAKGWRRGWVLHDRRRRRNLRLLVGRLRLRIGRLSLRVAWLGLGLPRERIGLNGSRQRRYCGNAGLGHWRLAGGTCSRATAKLPQPLLELTVAILQFLVLAGQLPQLVFKPLDPHLEVGIVGLRGRL